MVAIEFKKFIIKTQCYGLLSQKLNTIARRLPIQPSSCMVHVCFQSPYLTQSNVFSYSQAPVCLPGLLCLLCLVYLYASVVSLLTLSPIYSYIHACMVSYGYACLSGLLNYVSVVLCMSPWSPTPCPSPAMYSLLYIGSV